MARVIDDSRFIDTKLRENKEQSLISFSEKLGSAPTFVTYFNRKLIASTADKQLDNVYQVVGSKSPTKFNRIDKFPIYKIDTMSLDRSFGDFGAEADITLSGEVLPGTITPYPDDIIFLEYNQTEGNKSLLVLRVDNVTDSVMDNRKYFKLSFSLYEKPADWVIEQTQEHLVFDISDYENNRTPILPLAMYETLRKCRAIRSKLSDSYLSLFHDKDTNCIAHFRADRNSFNILPAVQLLAEKFGIFSFDRKFLKTAVNFIYPHRENEFYLLQEEYERTPYSILTREAESDSLVCSFLPNLISDDVSGYGSIFSSYCYAYHSLIPWPATKERNDILSFSALPYFEEHIKAGVLYTFVEPEEPPVEPEEPEEPPIEPPVEPPLEPEEPPVEEPDDGGDFEPVAKTVSKIVNTEVTVGRKHTLPLIPVILPPDCPIDPPSPPIQPTDPLAPLEDTALDVWLENLLILYHRDKTIPFSMYEEIIEEAANKRVRKRDEDFLRFPAIIGILKIVEEQIVPVISKPKTYERV